MSSIIIEPMRKHVEWWAERTARRIIAGDPSRPPFERDKFLQRIADRPGAEELAAKFEQGNHRGARQPQPFPPRARASCSARIGGGIVSLASRRQRHTQSPNRPSRPSS